MNNYTGDLKKDIEIYLLQDKIIKKIKNKGRLLIIFFEKQYRIIYTYESDNGISYDTIVFRINFKDYDTDMSKLTSIKRIIKEVEEYGM